MWSRSCNVGKSVSGHGGGLGSHYNQAGMTSVTKREADARLALLTQWIVNELGLRGATIVPASEDASFRRYFRVQQGDRSFVAMDAPPERESLAPFVHVAHLLENIGVHVPHVHEEDRARGFLLLSDLGSRHYLEELVGGADAAPLYSDAIDALVRMQADGLPGAAELDPYDVGRLKTELALFPDWFLSRHLEVALAEQDHALLTRVGDHLVDSALAEHQVFVHRDYHSRNLMLCADRNPGILDFQDAVRGALSYDLVSLLKDCYIVWPRARVLEWLRMYRSRALRAGVPVRAHAELVRDFDLMGVQRHLKVLGIFARLWYRDGKRRYLDDLPRVLAYVLEITPTYGELTELDAYLRGVVTPRFDDAQRRARA
jgi:aminoglycoside/choline kinase family phosphotransferase